MEELAAMRLDYWLFIYLSLIINQVCLKCPVNNPIQQQLWRQTFDWFLFQFYSVKLKDSTSGHLLISLDLDFN